MDQDAADRTYIESFDLPENAVVTGLISVLMFIDPTDGESKWKVHCDADSPVTMCLGMLELAKLDVIARSATGLPINYPPGDPRRHPAADDDD